MRDDVLSQLAAVIADRTRADADKSYTKKLLDGGVELCAKKLGEEATETIIAALAQDADALKNEAADLLYHLLVLLRARNVDLADVLKVLDARTGLSGLDEKAARGRDEAGP